MSQNHERLEHGTPPATPRWVKAFGVIALILVLLIGIMLLSGVQHGPGMHLPPASATESK